MIRNIKALGLAVVAVLAMSAVAASAAQAEVATHFGPAGIVKATGGAQTFTPESEIGLNCEEVHGTGQLSKPSSTLTIDNIEYTGCSAVGGFFPVKVDMNSCDYTFHSGTGTVEEEKVVTAHGEVSIECTNENDSISVTVHPFGDNEFNEAPVCTYHIGPQTVGGITYHNETDETGRMYVTVTTATGQTIVVSHEGELCGEGEEHAEYNGMVTALAENEFNEAIDTTITPTLEE